MCVCQRVCGSFKRNTTEETPNRSIWPNRMGVPPASRVRRVGGAKAEAKTIEPKRSDVDCNARVEIKELETKDTPETSGGTACEAMQWPTKRKKSSARRRGKLQKGNIYTDFLVTH